jgi:transposase-like protein
MKCQHCGSEAVVKNGCSRHGRQRWLCRACGKTSGERDQRRVESAKRASALAHYLEGVGLRATERLVGVSHNAVMNWVLEAVAGKALAHVKPTRSSGWKPTNYGLMSAKKNGLLAVVGY